MGIAILENTLTFTPASDGVLDTKQFSKLPKFWSLSKRAVNILKISFLLSLVHNFVCISWTVTGQLSLVLAVVIVPKLFEHQNKTIKSKGLKISGEDMFNIAGRTLETIIRTFSDF
ncbi:MAG: hypothetical protein ACI9QN_002754 [Arcticibacterium sp.]